jgi:hypothetical protein
MLLIGLARFLRRLLVAAETAKPSAASAGRQAGPVDDHGRRAPDVHLSRRPAGKIEERRLAADDFSATAPEASATNAGSGDDVCDSRDAHDRNVRAFWIHCGLRNQIRIEFAKLVRIHGTRHALADFVQPHLGDRVEHAGIDFEAARFDHLRPAGNGYALPYRGDFSVADDDGRTFDRRPGNWVDLCSGDGVNALRVRRRRGRQP